MPRREVTHHRDALSIHWAFTDAADGDLSVDGDPDDLSVRRSRIAPHPWTWLRQVHGSEVVHVHAPGDFCDELADAAVTMVPDAVLAVHSADCAGIVLSATDRNGQPIIGVVHAGWRGLESGVVQHTVQQMRDLGGDGFTWDLGPCISPGAYEFGTEALDVLRTRYGNVVVGETLDGKPALDLRAGVRVALGESGVTSEAMTGPPPCTALDPGFYSWRARGDTGRQAAVAWLASPDERYPWHP